jgi:hypothetical protein
LGKCSLLLLQGGRELKLPAEFNKNMNKGEKRRKKRKERRKEKKKFHTIPFHQNPKLATPASQELFRLQGTSSWLFHKKT